MSGSVAIVVGASSGIGECLARRLARSGTSVALLARRGAEVERIAGEITAEAGSGRAIGIAHDVTDVPAVDSVWERIQASLGPVDALYFAAAIMEEVGAEEYDTEKDRRHFETNSIGAVAWVNAAARRFGPAGRGTIVGISSVAQDRGRTGRPAYNASKAAMDTHLEAVRNRLWRKGVVITTVRPGFVATPMTAGVKGMFWVISADRAAELTIAAARRRRAVVYIPARWRLVMTVIRAIPSFLFRRLDL